MDTPTTITLVISACSFFLAGLSLGWNIYRDVVLKARLKVSLSIGVITGQTEGWIKYPERRYVWISGSNHGPGNVRIDKIVAYAYKDGWWNRVLRRRRMFIIKHEFTNQLSGHLPCTLEVGEKMQLMFQYDKDVFLKANLVMVGLNDTFDRTHWISRKEVRRATREYKQDFLDKEEQKDRPGS